LVFKAVGAAGPTGSTTLVSVLFSLVSVVFDSVVFDSVSAGSLSVVLVAGSVVLVSVVFVSDSV